MITLPISKKIIINNDKTDIVTTTYNQSFISNINTRGRRKHNFELLDDEQFRKCINQKIRQLKGYNRKLDAIAMNNDFNFFITLNKINSLALKKFIDRVHKADKELKYVTLACWTIDTGLHYHILFNTSLTASQLQDKLKLIDNDVKPIYDLKYLINYFKKNINFNTCHILTKFDNEELKDIQIEILEYSKILVTSKNVKMPKIIKNPTEEQLQDVYSSNEYLESFEYTKLDSTIIVDKFKNSN